MRSPKLLLIVDDWEALDVYVEKLRAALPSAELETAFLWRDALEKAKRFAPDRILMDLVLEDQTGPEMLAKLRADAESARAPVTMVLSAEDEPPAATEHWRNEGDVALRRPYEWPDLLRSLLP